MNGYLLSETDTNDIEGLLVQIAESFNIKFDHLELSHIQNFGELCDHIINKIELAHADDCSTQQAFYKLRNAIKENLHIDEVTPQTKLSLILPRHKRVKKVTALERSIGFKLSILHPRSTIVLFLLALLFISIITFFINWQIGIAGLLTAITGIKIAYRRGKELDLQTVGQVAQKMQREHYLKSRRNSQAVNKNELRKVLTDWFITDLELDSIRLNSDAELPKS